LNSEEERIFSTDGVSGVKNFKVCLFWLFVLCLWCDQSEFMAVFMVFNFWICSGFIFKTS